MNVLFCTVLHCAAFYYSARWRTRTAITYCTLCPNTYCTAMPNAVLHIWIFRTVPIVYNRECTATDLLILIRLISMFAYKKDDHFQDPIYPPGNITNANNSEADFGLPSDKFCPVAFIHGPYSMDSSSDTVLNQLPANCDPRWLGPSCWESAPPGRGLDAGCVHGNSPYALETLEASPWWSAWWN